MVPFKKVMVAMSGGVDSSVAALLLQQQGVSIVGVTMCLGVAVPGDESWRCCGAQAIADARKVCDHLGIAHYVMDYARLFQSVVVDPFIAEYRAGRTPNPCVACNQHLKFGTLLDKALAMGFEAVATGHYAQVLGEGKEVRLCRPFDEHKDQTYFLYSIARNRLAQVLFPLAALKKEAVRAAAVSACLPVAHKPESQDVCFADNGDYRSLLLSAEPGLIIDTSGKKLGEHTGIGAFTIGQRKGLGIAAGRPLYVVNIDPLSKTVTVGDKEALGARRLLAHSVSLLVDSLPSTCLAQIRYAHTPAVCSVQFDGTALQLEFEQTQFSVTPGQSVVLYSPDNTTVLGGGIIDRAIA